MSNSLPKSYKAWVVKEKGGPLTLVDKELKAPPEGEILVKVIACGVCHSDVLVKEDLLNVGLPRVPGHEIVGEVAAVPASEKRWKVGDRVGSGWHGGHDLTCDECLNGSPETCDNRQVNGIFRDGGYAEYCYLRTEAVIAVPKNIDPFETAPLFCAGVTTFNGIRNVPNVRAGELVAVQGIGGLGHLAIPFAVALGYDVAALSTTDNKKDLATKLGAKHFIAGSPEEQVKKLQELGKAKVIIVTAPHAKSIPPLTNAIKPHGTLLMLAVPMEPLAFNFAQMVPDAISVQSHASGGPLDWADTIKLATTRDIHTMIEKFPFDKAPEAYDHMMSGKVRFRAVLQVS